MNSDILIILYIFAYLLIGIFVSSAIAHFDDSDFSSLCLVLWPVVVAFFVVVGICYIPYLLGKWVGYVLHDALGVIR